MAVCEVCGKGVQFGHNVSHSKHATKRKWLPNVQRKIIHEGGRKRRVYICTKCLKALSKT